MLCYMFNKLICTYFNNLPTYLHTYLTHLWHTYLPCFVQSPNEWICWNSTSLNWKNHKLTWSYHKLPIPKFCNGSLVKIVLSWVHIFCTQMSCIWCMYNWDEIFSFMYTWKYFIPIYTHIIHVLMSMTFMSKKYEPTKKQFLHTFHY